MNPSHHPGSAARTRAPLPRPVILLATLLAQLSLAGCGAEPTTEPTPQDVPTPRTAPYTLASGAPDPDTEPDRGAFRGVLTTESHLGVLDFRYDALVVTALRSGRVTLRADVLDANPDGYRYGYGYPLHIATLEDSASPSAYGGDYLQNALETGTALVQYPVLAGRQYVLVYKTFGKFTPLTYRLTLPAELKLEGRIDKPLTPVPVPEHNEGPITLDNPRPEALRTVVEYLRERVSSN